MPDVEGFDDAIIGGGISGCGTFRDLCAQAARTPPPEREDFRAGTAQASSRLLHGGLKPLETGGFRLVRHPLGERNRLLATAPLVVAPPECLAPVRSTFGGLRGSAPHLLRRPARPGDRGLPVAALGMRLYDL